MGIPALQIKGRIKSNINVGSDHVFPEMKLCGLVLFPKQNYNVLSPNFHIHVTVSDLHIPRMGLSFLLQPNRQTDPGNCT